MENQVWEQVTAFLKDFRCSDMDRSNAVHLRECMEEKEVLRGMRKAYDSLMAQLSQERKEFLKEYLEQIESVSFEEQHEAYCQGIVDCIQILVGLGLLDEDEKLKSFLGNIGN